jgi:Tfp pilus assembly protein PilP
MSELMRSAITVGLGLLMGAIAPGLRAQVNPATTTNNVKSALGDKGQTAQQTTKPPAKPATQAPPAPTSAAKPAPQTAKPAAKPTAKPGAKSSSKRAAKGAAKAPAKAVEKPSGISRAAAAESELKQARRDPFESLINRQQGKGGPALPPGKAGLQVSTLRLDGIVKAPNGMIAVVTNPQSRTYFLREGDHLYDGSVEKITMDGVSFHEEGKDAFGKPVERQVNKRIYSTSSGEQQ